MGNDTNPTKKKFPTANLNGKMLNLLQEMLDALEKKNIVKKEEYDKMCAEIDDMR